MTFKHKLSRRLAVLFGSAALLTGGALACGEAPTSAADEIVERPSYLDPTLAITATTEIGTRVQADRRVSVYRQPSRRSSSSGKQPQGATGTIVEGPSPLTAKDPYPLWRVDFDSGADGWVLGAYMSQLSAPIPVATPTVVAVASVSVSPSSHTLSLGSTVTLAATVRDSSGNALTDRSISWTTSNASIATVSGSGAVTGIASGTVTVTATAEGHSASASITVPTVTPAPVATITVSPTTATIGIGATAQLVATLRDASNNILTGRTVTWSSSNGGVAFVSATGLVSGIGAGSATVTATSEGRTATAAVTVPAPATSSPANFASRWLTATGNTQTAFLDATNAQPWVFACCTGATNTSIVPASSLNLTKWPSGNVYRVGTLASFSTSIPTHQIVADLGVPAAGSTRYFRYYLQVTYGDDHGASGDGNIEHGVETSPSTIGGGNGMNFYRIPRNDGTWWPGYREISTGYRYIANGLRLLKNRTYRMEWSLAYGTSTYRVAVRIYDEDGVLVATENDFHMILPTTNLNARLGAENFAYRPGDHRYFRVGTNGPSSNFPMQNMRDENLFLHGAVAVCSTGWCGPAAP